MTENEVTAKVKFRQLSSGVTATVTYEESGPDVDENETLKKAEELYDKAQKVAMKKTSI